jgi:hypothetical protein
MHLQSAGCFSSIVGVRAASAEVACSVRLLAAWPGAPFSFVSWAESPSAPKEANVDVALLSFHQLGCEKARGRKRTQSDKSPKVET